MKVVDLIDQFLLESFKLAVVAELFVAFPVVQRGQYLLQILTRLRLGKTLVCHILDADFDQIVHITVGIGPVRKAPFAVILVERSIRVAADERIIKRHAAALADQLARRAEQGVDRNVKKSGKQLQGFCVGDGFAVLPARNGLTGHIDFTGQFILRQAFL